MRAQAGVGTMFTFSGDFLVGISYPTLSKPDVLSDYAFLIFLGLLVVFIVFIYFCCARDAPSVRLTKSKPSLTASRRRRPSPWADVDPF